LDQGAYHLGDAVALGVPGLRLAMKGNRGSKGERVAAAERKTGAEGGYFI
jgi:hypothetical protein